MKQIKIALPILFLMIILLFCSCSSEAAQEEKITLDDPIGYYESALARHGEQPRNELYTIASKRLVSQQYTFKETTNQRISIDPNSEIQVLQEIYYSDQPLSTQLNFKEDTAYLQLNGNSFSQQMDYEAFCNAYFPTPLPDPNHYAEVVGTETENGTVITFRQPVSQDAYSLSACDQLHDITTSVVIDSDGFIVFLSQQAEYTLQGITVHAFYALSYAGSNAAFTFSLPENAIPVENLQYPLMAEKASGYLLQAENALSATFTKQLSSEVTNSDYSQTILLTRNASGTTIETNVSLTDHSRGDSISNFRQTESFGNGKYSISTNGEDAQAQDNITEERFLSYFNNFLLESILLPQHITGIEATQTDGLIHLEFETSDDLARILAENTCKTLYQELELLSTMLDSCTKDSVSVYLAVDPVIGIPYSAGIQFSGKHTLDNTSYAVTSDSNITYSFN